MGGTRLQKAGVPRSGPVGFSIARRSGRFTCARIAQKVERDLPWRAVVSHEGCERVAKSNALLAHLDFPALRTAQKVGCDLPWRAVVSHEGCKHVAKSNARLAHHEFQTL